MGPRSLIVDGYDVGANLNFVLLRAPGKRSASAMKMPLGDLPSAMVQPALNSITQMEPRKMDVVGHFVEPGPLGFSAANQVDLHWRELKYRLLRRETTIRFADDETWELETCRVQGGAQALDIDPALIQRGARVTIPIVARDPRWHATVATSLPFSTATAITLGSAPSRPRITTTTAAYTLTYKAFGGATIATMQIAASGTPVEVRMDEKRILVAGVDEPEALVAGDFFWFDPLDGNPYAGPAQEPTIESTVGGNTAVFRVNHF